MSFKGEVEARCPKGCEPFEAEVWSYVRGDQSQELRDAVLAREFNLLLCPACGTAFFPDASYVYFDPRAEILAFVFPESYRARADYWREKMRTDFIALKESLGRELPLDLEPSLFFGPEELGRLLEDDDWRGEEREVMEFIANDLRLSLYRVSPRFAREHKIPASLPFKGERATRASVMAGLEAVVAANDRLTAFSDYLGLLKSGAELPPAASARP